MIVSENLIAQGLDQIDVGIGIFDTDLRLVFCNKQFKMLRSYPDELCLPGVSLPAMLRFNAERGDFGPGDVEQQVRERIDEITQSGQRHIEREMFSGQILSIRYQQLDNGGLTVSYEDKTEERKTQNALNLSEERYALISEAAEEAIYEWDVASNRIFASPRLQKFTGHQFDSSGKRHWRWEDHIHPDEVALYRETLAMHRSGELARWQCEYRFKNAAGEYRWVSDHGTSIRDDQGQAIRMVAAIQDITERINKEAELAASEERYQLITRASSDGIYEWDIGTDSLFVSDKLKQMFGFGAESLQSRRWASAIHRDDYDQYLSSVVEHIKGNTENLQCEYRIEGADGVYRWVRDHGIGVRGKSGRVQRLVGAVSDITDIMAAEAELDQATSRLLDSLETISDGFLLVDSNDRVQLFNRRYLEIFGGTIDSDISDIVFIGQPFMTMIREGYNHGMFKPVSGGVDTWIAARRKAREKPAAELEMELSNGSWLLVNERQMTDGGRVSVYTDVTEFKKRELELKTAHSRFADAIEALSTGFALFDSQDRLIVCNTKYTEYFPQLADHVRPGIPFADLIRAGVERGLFPEAVNNWDSWFTGLQKQRTTSDGIREQHMKGGLWLQISDHRTKEGGIVSIYTDVSELKKREEELHQQSTVLKATLENMDQGISMVDENLNVVSFNHKFLEYLQFPDEQFTIGFPMEQAFRFNALRGEYGEGDIDQQVAQRLELASRFEPHRFERVRKDKTVLEIVGIPVSGGGFVTTYTDITPKKQREVELISARDAAQQALRDLELAQERLVQSEKMASLGQLTAGIAHEIKNPLNFVNNFAKLSQELLEELNEIIEAPLAALAQDPREDAEELLGLLTSNLGKIDQHGRRADSIVKNMLLHSRDGPSISQSVDLNGLVDEALNLAYHGLRAENPNLNVELIKNFSAEVGQVECFPQDLMRVFLNLMSNGIYASNQRYLQIDVSQPNASPDTFSPTLIVTTMTLNDQITIEVTDNGVGISDDIRDKLFLPFFTTKPAGEGTGLGLSLSYDIVVKQHGGELSVESQLGDYATFKVTLPCSLPKDINTPGGEE